MNESDILRTICEWFRDHNFFFWRMNNIPVFGRSKDGKMRFRALPKYTPKGLPDIIVLHEGRLYAVEVKRAGGKLRPEQKDICRKIEENGGKYVLADNLEIIIAIFGRLMREKLPEM